MNQPALQKTTILQEIGSVVVSIFGVQTSKSRERDFTGGIAKRFLILGLLKTPAVVMGVKPVSRSAAA